MVKVTVPFKPTIKASTLQKPSNNVTDQASCSICLDELTKTKGKLPCGHEFCFSCIERWSKETNKCPLCKKRFDTIQKNTKHTETSVNVKKKDIPIANPPPRSTAFMDHWRIVSRMIRQQVLRTQRLRTQGTNTENAISLVSDDESDSIVRVSYRDISSGDSDSSDAEISSSDDSCWSESSDDDSSSDWEP